MNALKINIYPKLEKNLATRNLELNPNIDRNPRTLKFLIELLKYFARDLLQTWLT